jgi:hypothetical protein
MLIQYAFFALAMESPAGELVPTPEAWLLETVRSALRRVRGWLGLPSDPGDFPADLAQPKDARVLTWTVYASGRLEDTDRQRVGFVQARGHSDTLIVETGYGRRGPATDGAWDGLRIALWSPPAVPACLGQTLCYGGIVPGVEEMTRQATQALASREPGELRQCELPYGWLFDHPQVSDVLALFYPDEAAEKRAEIFFHFALPLLAMYAHKVAREYWDYERGLRPGLDAAERALAQALTAAAQPQSDLLVLEGQLQGVASAYAVFSNDLSTFEGRRQSVAINVRNFGEALARHELPTAGPLAARQAALQRWLGRMEADEGYHQAVVRRAEMTLRGLQVQAEVKRAQAAEAEARAEQRTNLWLAAVGITLAVGQIVDQDAADWLACWTGVNFGLTLTRALGITLALLLAAGGYWLFNNLFGKGSRVFGR